MTSYFNMNLVDLSIVELRTAAEDRFNKAHCWEPAFGETGAYWSYMTTSWYCLLLREEKIDRAIRRNGERHIYEMELTQPKASTAFVPTAPPIPNFRPTMNLGYSRFDGVLVQQWVSDDGMLKEWRNIPDLAWQPSSHS